MWAFCVTYFAGDISLYNHIFPLAIQITWVKLKIFSVLSEVYATNGIDKFPLAMMMSSDGNIFRITSPLWGEITGHMWIPLTKGQQCWL